MIIAPRPICARRLLWRLLSSEERMRQVYQRAYFWASGRFGASCCARISEGHQGFTRDNPARFKTGPGAAGAIRRVLPFRGCPVAVVESS